MPPPPAGPYIGVNGQAKNISDIYIGVGGQAKKVSKAYVGVNGQAKLFYNALPPADPVLENNSWETIAYYSSVGLGPSLWSLGDTKQFALSTGEVLNAAIYGFNHDAPYTITFGMGRNSLLADTRVMNNTNTNSGSFKGSTNYAWIASVLYSQIPSDLQSVIKIVNKKTSVGNASPIIQESSYSLWLFSEVEVLGDASNSYPGEGTKYPIFTNNESRRRWKKNSVGSSGYAVTAWWLRSPRRSDSIRYVYVGTDGATNYDSAVVRYAINFGFCV